FAEHAGRISDAVGVLLLFQLDAGDDVGAALALHNEPLGQIILEGPQAGGRQGQQDGQSLVLPQQVDPMGVFAGFGAALAAAAELVEGAGGAVPDFAGPGVQAVLAVGAAAVGQAARAVEVVLPVDIDRVVMDDHAGEGLGRLGVVGVVARHLKGQPAAAGDL